MNIVRGRAMKSRYWRCDHLDAHVGRQPVRLDWDYGLPPKAKQFVEAQRNIREEYRKKRTAEGKENFVAIRTRKPWQRGNVSVRA